MSNIRRILVLQGGDSPEREVSLRSGAAVADAARQAGYALQVADPSEPGFDLSKAVADCDGVLPILHGAGGEDGTVQAELERLGVPFLGSGSQACTRTFNKSAYRDFVTARGVQIAEGQVVNRAEFDTDQLRSGPYVLKPVDGGSSVDTVIVRDTAKQPAASYFDELFARHTYMLLERLIEGKELTVGVLSDRALPVILIVPPQDGEFDYDNKYNGRTDEIVDPDQIDDQTKRRAQELAIRVHQLTSCRHLSRTDMILAPDGELFVLETNTIPGMTGQSLFPKMAAADGIDMPALIRRFVDLMNE